MQMEKEKLVSIVVLTYNHSKYISKALDSILMQKGDLISEILIGDDCSSDGTQEILLKYKNNYPDMIQLVLREKNIGATMNLHELYINANGKYIAQLEGDDYWSDENKLEKQIRFLEMNTEYIASSHLTTVVDEYGNNSKEKNQLISDTYWNYTKSEFTLDDCKDGKYPGHFSSLVFRNIFVNPKFDYSIIFNAHKIIADRTLILILTMNGKLYRLEEFMSCYRYIEKNTAENWQSLARQKNRRYEEYHYIRLLEKYVQNELNKSFTMINLRKEKLVCATVVLLNHWNRENLKVVLSIIFDSGCRINSFLLTMNAIIQKIYYRKICKVDRPVKY